MRARGFALRDAFPDVLKGLVTSEEARDYIDITPSADIESTPNVNLPEQSKHLPDLLDPMTDQVTGNAKDLPQAVVDAFDAKGIGGGEMERWIARAVDVRMTNQELLDHIGTYTPRGKAKAAAKRNLTTEPDMEPEREPGDEPIEDGAQQELPA